MRRAPRILRHCFRGCNVLKRKQTLLSMGLMLVPLVLHADLYTYEFTGNLSLSSGPDTLGLHGGQFTLNYTVDSTSSPVGFNPQAAFDDTDYTILSTELVLAGTSSDGNYFSTASPDVIELTDVFGAGTGGNDSLVMLNVSTFSVGASTLTFDRLFVDFGSDMYFTGTDAAPTPLPIFDTGDTLFFTIANSPQATDGSSNYSTPPLSMVTSISAIPEPSAFFLLALGGFLLLRPRFRR